MRSRYATTKATQVTPRSCINVTELKSLERRSNTVTAVGYSWTLSTWESGAYRTMTSAKLAQKPNGTRDARTSASSYSSSISKLYAIGVGYLINPESFLDGARTASFHNRSRTPAGWPSPISRSGALGTVAGRPHLLLPDSVRHPSAALDQRSAARLDGCGLPVARQAGDRAQAPVSAGSFRTASGLYRFERNFDCALARSIPELAAHESRVPGAGRNRGRAEPATTVAGAHPGVVVTAFRARGGRLSRPGNTPTAWACR